MADFTRAEVVAIAHKLEQADLRKTNLDGANLQGVNLRGSDLSEAKYDATIKWRRKFPVKVFRPLSPDFSFRPFLWSSG